MSATPKSLTENVKKEIVGWIREGKFPPGSQLPSVVELTRRLNVSRTVVRESLQSLVGMKLVEIRPGMGCYVCDMPSELLVNSDVMAALLDMKTLIEVAEARRAIEGSVAFVAASTANAEDFEEMEMILFRIERALMKSAPMYSLTPPFHVAIAKATHNRVLEQVVSSCNSLMTAAGSVIERVHFGAAYRKAEYETHAKLLDVLKQGDPVLARDEMERHIQITVDLLLEIQKSSPEPFQGRL